MRAISLHSRRTTAPVDVIGSLIDTLASPDDRLWPRRAWPAMRFDRPLGIGADGGHAFVRYHVAEYRPGRRIAFRLTGPRGLTGTHTFEAGAAEGGSATRAVGSHLHNLKKYHNLYRSTN